MRFLHTSDLHIGKTVCGFSMLEEQRHALEQMLQIVKEQRVDVILLSGDLYDRALPPAQAVTLLDEFLTSLIEEGVLVCAIAGNHDSGERIGFVNRILEHRGLYLKGIQEEKIFHVDWSDGEEQIRIHLMPFARPAELRALYQTDISNSEDGMRALLDHVDYLETGKNVLLTHQFVVNQGREPELSDSETRVSVGGADQIEVSDFARFDYVALGHIHGPQQIGNYPVYYSGSPVKYSFSEVNHCKSVIVGEWTMEGELKLQRIPIVPIHQMRKIKGKLADLIAPEVVAQAEEQDYLLVILTNEEELVDPIGTLRSVYPNVMQLQLERPGRQGDSQEVTSAGWKEKTPYDMFCQFYEHVTNLELSGEQKVLIQDVIEQAEEELL